MGLTFGSRQCKIRKNKRKKEKMKFTNEDILMIALRQSAIDSSCAPEDFLGNENKIFLSRPSPDARRYLTLPYECDLTSYGSCVVASVSERCYGPVETYIKRFSAVDCFETPGLHILSSALRSMGLDVCFMAHYCLPDVGIIRPLDCPYETRILTRNDFGGLYLPEWSNALCAKRPQLDMLGVGAYDGERLIGFAAASADCDTMWQIGIDVLPEYRRRGIASALTSRLACEILDRGYVPFYCHAWSNLASSRNAIKSGFRPAWVTVTAKSIEYIDEINGKDAN